MSIRALLLPALGLGFALAAGGCGLPRDASGTLERVRHGTMRVGFVVDTPWVTLDGGRVGGVEAELVQELARRTGSRIRWVHAPQPDLLESVGQRQVDLVVGGLTESLPWSGKVAFTKPYYTDSVAVGGLPQGAGDEALKDRVVAVKEGDPVSAELRKKDAHPRMVADLASTQGAVAAPTWELAAMGRGAVGQPLKQNAHVLAAPPGENAWLVEIERMLHDRKPFIPARLRREKP